MKNLPTPLNISNIWSFGSIVGLSLSIQIISGIFISMHYCNSTNLAFFSTIELSRNIKSGFFIKIIHANSASLMFFLLYFHIYRSIYNKSAKNTFMWISGFMLVVITMATAFLGYVLPWGNISFWAATVITNLFTSLPYLGKIITEWIWGGFSVDNPTLNRFFSFHFLIPLIIRVVSLIHLRILHGKGSTNPTGLNSNIDKIPFYQFFSRKDLIFFFIVIIVLNLLFQNPNLFIDPENFTPANPLSTPVHIQPEWYFLFVYAILRSIPRKLGGVVALFSALIIIILKILETKNSKFSYIKKLKCNITLVSFLTLTYLGRKRIDEPYVFLTKIIRVFYFFSFLEKIQFRKI